jgi:hypothetical protein
MGDLVSRGEIRHEGSDPMQINRDAPIVSTKDGIICATPDRVWEALADVSSWSAWHPEIRSAALQGAFEPGTQFRWKSGAATINSTLQVVEKPTLLGWVGRSTGLTARHMFHLHPDDGHTRLTIEESMEGPTARLLKRFLSRMLDRSLEAWIAGLKRRTEAPTSS